MAVRALRLLVEDFPSPARLFAQGVRLIGLETNPGRIRAYDGALESGDGFDDIVRSGGPAKDSLKQLSVDANLIDAGGDVVDAGASVLARSAHVAAAPSRQRLPFQGTASSIPVELGMVANVPEGWAGPRQWCLVGSDGLGQAVGQTVFFDVARVTGTRTVCAQPLIMEKLLAEGDLLHGHRVVGWNDHGHVTFQFRPRLLGFRQRSLGGRLATDRPQEQGYSGQANIDRSW